MWFLTGGAHGLEDANFRNCHPPSPELLVLQVEAEEEHVGIQWTRTPIALNVSSDELVDFQQTFVRMISEEDWGLYQANLICSNFCTTNTRLKWSIISSTLVDSSRIAAHMVRCITFI